MNSNPAPGFDAALARLAAQGASAAQIAEALLDAWRSMESALVPIVGQRGVAALFSRALHVTGKDHPWLAASPLSFAGPIDLAPLRTALCARQGTAAAVAGDAFLHNFRALLASLIGPSLADHLVGSVRIDTSSGDAAQGN